MTKTNSSSNFSTTLSRFGLATSLKCDGESYFLSTVVRKGYFETILYGTSDGSGRNVLCNSQRDTQMQAVLCHIEIAKKLISSPPCHGDLSWLQMSSFKISDESPQSTELSQWREPHFIMLLQGANINYHEPKDSKVTYLIAMIAIGLVWYFVAR